LIEGGKRSVSEHFSTKTLVYALIKTFTSTTPSAEDLPVS